MPAPLLVGGEARVEELTARVTAALVQRPTAAWSEALRAAGLMHERVMPGVPRLGPGDARGTAPGLDQHRAEILRELDGP